MSDSIVWLAPCGSWGGCDVDDLIVICKADMTTDEWEAITDDDTDDPAAIIIAAYDRIKYGGTSE
ncbi:MAG: hypothetical protein ACO39Z_04815 [Paracoccaceae bacterium]